MKPDCIGITITKDTGSIKWLQEAFPLSKRGERMLRIMKTKKAFERNTCYEGKKWS